jgi:hypothetical protein
MSAQTGGNRNTIIIIVVVVVILCCCCLVAAGGYYAFTQGMLNSITGTSPTTQSLLQLLA